MKKRKSLDILIIFVVISLIFMMPFVSAGLLGDIGNWFKDLFGIGDKEKVDYDSELASLSGDLAEAELMEVAEAGEYAGDGSNWCDGADFDKDRRVWLSDWGVLRANFGSDINTCYVENNWCQNSDIDKDGKVWLSEWGVLRANFGRDDCFGETLECIDSDVSLEFPFGLDYYQKGNVGNNLDKCSNNQLKEYFCEDDVVKEKVVDCTCGNEGACLLVAEPPSNSPPTVGEVLPPTYRQSDVNKEVFITSSYNDRDGWNNLRYGLLLISDNVILKNAVFLRYIEDLNLVYLADDNGEWDSKNLKCTPGHNKILENSQASINCMKINVVGNGNEMRISWPIIFKTSFSGSHKVYLHSKDDAAKRTGFIEKAEWNVINPNNNKPDVGTVIPSLGTSPVNEENIFTTTYTDSDGWRDLRYGAFIISNKDDPYDYVGTVFIRYIEDINKVYLANDNGVWDATNLICSPGESKIIQNSYSSLDCSKVVVSGIGNTMTIKWVIKFKESYVGSYKTFLFAKDDTNANTDWVEKGSFSIKEESGDRLILHYSFDDNPLDGVFDSSTYGNDGICTELSCPGLISGKIGKAYNFNGADDFFIVGDNPLFDFDGSNSFTITAWIKPQSPENYDNIIASKYSYSENKGWMFSLTDYGAFPYLFMSFGKNNYQARSGLDAIDYNTWAHVAVVNSQNKPIKLFINGKQASYTTQDILNKVESPTGINLEIGRRADSFERKFKGDMDELKIWNKALSDSEILQEYEKRCIPDCDDNKECTNDVCSVGNVCSYVNLPQGSSCSIGVCDGEGICVEDIICNKNSDCGTNSYIGNSYCSGTNVYRDYKSFICKNAGTVSSVCEDSVAPRLIKTCQNKCFNGNCVECIISGDCNDDVSCTSDSCVNNNCVNFVRNDLCSSYEVCNPLSGCEQQSCAGCTDCDDWYNPFDCSYEDCHGSCSWSDDCYFKGNLLGVEDCVKLSDACLEIDECSDYSKEECVNNLCDLDGNGCELESGVCKEKAVCGDEVCSEGEDCKNCEADCGCSGNTPMCNFQGVCVECVNNIDCDDNKECTSDKCDTSSICKNTNLLQGSQCSIGICDGEGECEGDLDIDISLATLKSQYNVGEKIELTDPPDEDEKDFDLSHLSEDEIKTLAKLNELKVNKSRMLKKLKEKDENIKIKGWNIINPINYVKKGVSKININVEEGVLEKTKKELESALLKYNIPMGFQEKIDEINEKYPGWTANYNSVSVMPDEYKEKLSGLNENETFFNDSSVLGVMEGEILDVESDSNLPDSFDWRNVHGNNYLTSVKNQGGCGSCWAFAAAGAIESSIKLNSNNPNLEIDLSEQEMVSCNSGGNCGGGQVGLTLKNIERFGTIEEVCFPYKAGDEPCNNKCEDWMSRIWKIESSISMSFYGENKIEQLKRALIENGPLVVTMSVYDDFYFYSGDGIYRHVFGGYIGGHAIVLVGYGKHDGKTYWIVKNSWGSWWGDNGYFRIYSDEVGIDGHAYAVFNPIFTNAIERQCNDNDMDGYCNWGLGEKPLNCPNCDNSISDCDDSDRTIFQNCDRHDEITGRLLIKTVPERADLYVKNLELDEFLLYGKTPINIDLLLGDREILIKRTNYIDYFTTIEIFQEQESEINVELELLQGLEKPVLYQITNNLGTQERSVISSNKIVWMDSRNFEGGNYNYDIYMCDIENYVGDITEWCNTFQTSGGGLKQITRDLGEQKYPDFSGNIIAWEDRRTNNPGIYIYDLEKNEEKRISDSGYHVSVSGNKVIYNKLNDLYLYNYETGVTKQITYDSNLEANSEIYGDKIVWQEYIENENPKDSNWDIFMFDLEKEKKFQITNNLKNQDDPIILEDNIVWTDFRNQVNWDENSDIYMCDIENYVGDITEWCNTFQENGGGLKMITRNPARQSSPTISENYIVWSDDRNGNNDIYMYNILTEKEKRITIEPSSKWSFSISGDKIVWQDGRNGNLDVYMYIVPKDEPSEFCGNNIKENDEECDGGDDSNCFLRCSERCTCLPQSKIVNNEDSSVSGQLIMKLQKNIGGLWEDVETVSNQEVVIPSKDLIKLDIGGNYGWNLKDVKASLPGYYRVYAKFEVDSQVVENNWDFEVV